jgi:hypothetical protein
MGLISWAERKIEMKIVAALIERVFTNWISTVLGMLLGFAGVISAVYNLIPSTAVWQGHNVGNTLLAAAGVAVALAGAIAKDKNIGINPPTLPTKVGMIVLTILAGSMLWPVSAQAQAATTSTTASASNGFAATSEAVAIRYSGEWSVGTHVTESYDFADFGKTKANHLYVQGHELLAPTPGLSIYAGGLQFEPDLTALLKRTNLPASNFGVYFNGAAGNGVPSSGGSHISFLAGGGVKYALTSALTWQSLNVQYFRYGSNNGAAISTGLSFVFGK